MEVRIIKNCDVKLGGVVNALQACTSLSLPSDKALRLIEAGYAEVVDLTEVTQGIVDSFGTRDPGGNCWDWVKKHKPGLWSKHIKSIRESDMITAKESFSEMLVAWEKSDYEQKPSKTTFEKL